jgi:hypothetical protein
MGMAVFQFADHSEVDRFACICMWTTTTDDKPTITDSLSTHNY